jgi:hypothetical protein
MPSLTMLPKARMLTAMDTVPISQTRMMLTPVIRMPMRLHAQV